MRWQGLQILRANRRNFPLHCIYLLAIIIVFTIASQRSSGDTHSAQRKIRSLRVGRSRRQSNDTMTTRSMDNLMSSVEGTTMADIVTTMTPKESGPSSSPVKTPSSQKVSKRAKFRPFNLPENYSKTLVPSAQAAYINRIDTSAELEEYAEGLVPVSVFVGIRVESVQVDELKEELVLAMQLYLKWDDAFIRSDNTKDTKYEDASNAENYRTLDSSFVDKIWKPDLFLENLVKVEQPQLVTPLITLNVNPYTGTIVYLSRITITIACSMDFQYYPVDTQKCDLLLRSNSYTNDEIALQWADVVLLDTNEPNFYVQLSDFDSPRHIEEFVGFFYKPISALKFTILAKRKISYHMVQSYLPSVFFVFITWMCFLIPAKGVEVRIGIAMTTLLTLTAMFASIRESTPIVSYVKAIDIWMVFCIVFVFATLFEFAIIIYLQGYVDHYKEKQQALMEEEEKRKMNLSRTTIADDGCEDVEMKPRTTLEHERMSISEKVTTLSRKARYFEFTGRFIEKHAFLGFATGFFIFNIVYWWWLLSSGNYFEWSVEQDLNEL